MGRQSISKRLRFEVFKRDHFTCQYCGAHPPEAILEIDHVIACANDGPTVIDNLVTACGPCNRGKAAVPLSCVPQSIADKAAEVREREEQLRGYQEVMEAKYQRIEQECWRVIEILEPGRKDFPIKDFRSIKRFLDRLGLYEVIEAAEIAAERKPWSPAVRWRYFCGVCWGKIRASEPPPEPTFDPEIDLDGTLHGRVYGYPGGRKDA